MIINSIPNVMLREILSHVNPSDVYSCLLVCKKWNIAISNEYALKCITAPYMDCYKQKKIDVKDVKTMKDVCIRTFIFSNQTFLDKVDKYFKKFSLNFAVTLDCYSLLQPSSDLTLKMNIRDVPQKIAKNYCFFVKEGSKTLSAGATVKFEKIDSSDLTFKLWVISESFSHLACFQLGCAEDHIHCTDIQNIQAKHLREIETELNNIEPLVKKSKCAIQ